MNSIRTISKYLLAIFMITAGIMHFVNPAFFLKITCSFFGRIGIQDRQSEIVNLKLIIHEILEDYALPIHGDGVSHWARVLENELRLSKVAKANLTVVSLDWGIEIPKERIW